MAKARRAKKREIPKRLLLIPVALMGIGITVSCMNTNSTKIDTIGAQIETSEASDFIKDIFTEENTKYLPIVYKDPYETLTRADLEREFKDAGLHIKSISSDIIGTGTKIETDNATYTVLIYGDIDGNGQVNVRDVQCVVKHLLYGNGNELKGINRIAANVENEKKDVINVRDAQRIVQFIIGKKNIIDSKPVSDLISDKQAPVITLNGDNEVTVKVFEEYKDIGATVKDNLDPNVNSRLVVDTSNVNTKKPGDYKVTYNAQDASGNKAQTVTRTVHVVDYVKDIDIAIYPNQHYVVGQTITLENMVANAVYAYAGKDNKPIDISEIEFTPVKATENMIGTSEIKLTYRGATKTIIINVTEQVPTITLTGHDGATNLKIKVGDTYTEGATGYDETDKKELAVNIEGTVDTSKPGIYEVKYTTAPNSLGKVGTLTRKVEVVDYITNVTFETDNTFKANYVDGEKISLNGVTAYADYKYQGSTKIEDKLSCNVENVIYDRDNISNNTNKEIVVSYIVTDPIDGTSTTYESTNNTNNSTSADTSIRINIIKKFETIATFGTAINEGEIYTDILVATVKAGPNEDKISVDKLDIKVSPEDTDEDGCKPVAWTTASQTESDAVDIHLKGVKEAEYTITLTPKTDSTYKQSKTFKVDTKVNDAIDVVTIDGFVIENGESRLKIGNSATANLSFYHQYDGHDVKITKVPLSKVSAKICEENTLNEVTGMNAVIMPNSDGYASKIRITATDTAPSSDSGTIIRIVANAQNDATQVSGSLETEVYAKSRYDLELPSSSNIPLSLRDVNQDSGFEIRKFGDNYYTILPVKVYDQYKDEDGYKKITTNNITTNYSSIGSNNIVFDDGISEENNDSYIEVVGVNKVNNTYTKAKTGDEIEYVGIAIKDISADIYEEDELEGKPIKVYFGEANPKKEYNIEIRRKSIESLKLYENDTYSTTGYCYQDIIAAKVTSGERQEALTESNFGSLGCDIIKDGNSTDILGVQDLDKFGINYTVNSGVVTISFWAKEPGTYSVKPYIKVNGAKQSLNKTQTVTVNADNSVDKVTFENGNLGDDYFGNASIGSKQTNNVTFYHDYQRNGTGPVVESRKVDVDYKRITLQSANEDKMIVYRMSDGVRIANQLPTLAYGNVDAVRAEMSDETILTTVGEEITFTMEIDNSSYQASNYSKTFKVKATEKLVPDGIQIGEDGQTSISLYTTVAPNITNVKKIDDYIYTIVPITFKSGTTPITGILESNLTTESSKKTDNTGKITFISSTDTNDSSTQIMVKGFNKDSNGEYVEANGATKIEYVGIGIMSADTWFLEEHTAQEIVDEGMTQDEWEEYKLRSVKVYCAKYINAPITMNLVKGN